MLEVENLLNHSEVERSGRELLVIGHTYQPHREALLPSSGRRMDVVAFVNQRIYDECYKPIFVDNQSLPEGMMFSFYPGLRDWFSKEHPQEFSSIVEKVNTLPNKEYQVLGDPYFHDIMPLMPKEDQDMLIKIGKKAFEEDFGFSPKGLWFPEAAASGEALEAASDNGYEFVVLGSNQLKDSQTNPVKVGLGNGNTIDVVHFNSGISGSLSFEDRVSLNADAFLDNVSNIQTQTVSIGSDTEFYGHHKKDRDKFLGYLEMQTTLAKHGFEPFDAKLALQDINIQKTDVIEDSSWSCAHELGRWTGECDCDNPSERARQDKSNFYDSLNRFGEEINSRLDATDANWRDSFIDFFFENRNEMFMGNDSEKASKVTDENRLYWAKYCELIGRTSCGWFFGGDSGPEREIPKTMIEEIKTLVPDIEEHVIFEEQAA